jgi:formate-dependent nitrite reductase membrane component NrfD
VYDVPHPKPWGWKVSAYLWTKSIAAGALMIGAPLAAMGLVSGGLSVAAGVLATLFTVITACLLVWDLKRPDRVWRVVLTPNFRSWLVWGAYILMLYGLVSAAWVLADLAEMAALRGPLTGAAVILGAAAAGYSAFLFGQAEGRDFWQSPLLLWQLLAGAALAGSAVLVLAAAVMPTPGATWLAQVTVLQASVLATLGIVLAELYSPHPNKDVATAAALIKRGPLAGRFWLGYVLLGVLLPSALVVGALAGVSDGVVRLGSLSVGAGVLAAVLALVGLWLYEDVWVRAGQSVAMS